MAYLNSKGDLVGFDVEMAHQLAVDLGVTLEFALIDAARVPDQLESGEFDLAMTRAVTPDRARRVAYTLPYLKPTLAFLVEDHLRQEFGSRSALRDLDDPVIAVPGSAYYVERLREYLPQAEVVLIREPGEFFEAAPGRFHAMLYPAEMGSAWTLLHPEFSVAIPHPDVVQMAVGYAIRQGDPDFLAFLNTWLDFQVTTGRLDRLYQYWILGREESQSRPRWSVIRDVLHWVE
jgi:ABC-type amino acid transport substrate-binding protein